MSTIKFHHNLCFQVGQEDVYEISGVIPERYIEGLLEVCQLNSYERLQVFH